MNCSLIKSYYISVIFTKEKDCFVLLPSPPFQAKKFGVSLSEWWKNSKSTTFCTALQKKW